jgi:preprotein translocase subunit Sss1
MMGFELILLLGACAIGLLIAGAIVYAIRLKRSV